METGIPVYSANVFEPLGFIGRKLLDNFEHEYIIWEIDVDWMVNILPKNYPFYPTEYCGFMLVNDGSDKSKIHGLSFRKGRYC